MQRKTNLIITIIAIVSLITFLTVRYRATSTLDRYNQLEIGQTKALVEAIFGEDPEYACTYKSYEVWYLSGQSLFSRPFPHDEYAHNQQFDHADQLPNPYGYVMIAFNHSGQVHAYTWIGETHTVEYQGGSVEGSHLKLAPETAF